MVQRRGHAPDPGRRPWSHRMGPGGQARTAHPGRPGRHGALSDGDLARKGARVGVWLTAGEKNSSAARLTQSWTPGTVSGGSRPSRVSCRSKGERQQIEKSARSIFADGQDDRRRWRRQKSAHRVGTARDTSIEWDEPCVVASAVERFSEPSPKTHLIVTLTTNIMEHAL